MEGTRTLNPSGGLQTFLDFAGFFLALLSTNEGYKDFSARISMKRKDDRGVDRVPETSGPQWIFQNQTIRGARGLDRHSGVIQNAGKSVDKIDKL